jgi:chorismate mutase
MPQSLTSLRHAISDIDHQILSLLTERMKISKEIGLYKKDNNLPIYDPVREKEIIESYSE